METNPLSCLPSHHPIDGDSPERLALCHLANSLKTAVLGTSGAQGDADASYAPFLLESNGDFLVYVSSLARHTANLLRRPSASLLLIEDEQSATNLYARKRATWSVTAEVIERDGEVFQQRMKQFQEKFGEVIDTLANMQDFSLIRLKPNQGRLVLGFGAAFRLDGWRVQTQVHGRHRPSGT